MQGVAVVTRATAGIGEAIAMQLLENGRTVVALQRSAAPEVPSTAERLHHEAAPVRVPWKQRQRVYAWCGCHQGASRGVRAASFGAPTHAGH